MTAATDRAPCGTPWQMRSRLRAIVVGAVLCAACTLAARAGEAGTPPEASGPLHEVMVHRSAGVVTLELTNGIPIHVKPMPGAERVVVVVHFLGAELMEEGGLGLSRAAGASWHLGDRAEGGAMRLRSWASMDGLSVRATGRADELPAMAERLRVALTAPEVSTDLLERWTQRSRGGGGAGGRRGGGQSAERIMADAVTGALGVRAPEPDRLPSAEQTGDWLTWCVRSLPVEVAVAGDVAPGVVARTVGPVIAALPRRPADVVTDLTKRRATVARQEAEVVVREQASVPAGEAFVVVVFAGPGAGDLEGLRLGTLAAHAAGPRLAAALRAAEIESRHASFICMPGRARANSGVLIGSARITADRAGAERAHGIIQQVVAGLTKQGLSTEELAAATAAARRENERRLKEPENWATVLAGARFLGMSIDELGGAERAFSQATGTTVGEAVARLTGARGQVCVILLPGGKGEDAGPAPQTAEPK